MELSAHILFIEDDPEIRGLVADFLRQNGLRVSCRPRWRTTWIRLLDVWRSGPAHPRHQCFRKEDGLQPVPDAFRAAGNLPVIMLTARGGEIDRLLA